MNLSLIERSIVDQSEAEDQFINIHRIEDLPELGDTAIGDIEADFGILLIHGFAGSNREMLYLGNFLANAGYRCHIPLLPGHGTDSTDLLRYDSENWKEKVLDSYDLLQNESPNRKGIIAIGHSMGGSLSLWLAGKRRLTAVVSMAGPIRYPLPYRLMVRLVKKIPYKFFFETFNFHDKQIYQHPGIEWFLENYGRIGLKSLHDVFEVLDSVYEDLDKVDIPVCLIHATVDHTVPASQVEIALSNLRTYDIEVHWLNRSHHILLIDTDRNLVNRKVKSFLSRVTSELIQFN